MRQQRHESGDTTAGLEIQTEDAVEQSTIKSAMFSIEPVHVQWSSSVDTGRKKRISDVLV